jgi:hypothetical protein
MKYTGKEIFAKIIEGGLLLVNKNFIIIMFLLLLLLVGCVKGNYRNEKQAKNGQPAETNMPDKPDDSDTSNKPPERKTTPAKDQYAVPITEEDFFISGISIRDGYKEVSAKFGEPISKILNEKQESMHDEDKAIFRVTWVYEGISFQFWSLRDRNEAEPIHPDNLYGIVIENDAFETARGLKVGDTLSKVFERYGNRTIDPPTANKFSYEDEFGFLIINFVTENDGATKLTDKVITIEFLNALD